MTTSPTKIPLSVPLVDLGAQQAGDRRGSESGIRQVFAGPLSSAGPRSPSSSRPTRVHRGRALRRRRQRHRCAGAGTPRGRASCPAEEVILPANTFIATAEAVSRIGAVPVPVDVDPDYLLIDPWGREAVTGRHRRSWRCTCSGRSLWSRSSMPLPTAAAP